MSKFKKIRKIFVLILSFLILIPNISLATNDENLLNDKYLNEKYDLKDISSDKIPEGIIPLEINSEEELEKIFSDFENIEFSLDLLGLRNNVVSTKANGATGSREVYINYNMSGGLTIRLDADLDYYAKGSFGSINKVSNIRLALLGPTLFHDLTDKQTWSSINNGIANINGKADLNTYLIIKAGTFKISTRPVTIRFSYGLRELYHNVYVKVGDTVIRK